jgi:hypothetical protein
MPDEKPTDVSEVVKLRFHLRKMQDNMEWSERRAKDAEDHAAHLSETIQIDLKLLLEALGMFSGALPASPHDVMLEAIKACRQLRAELDAAIQSSNR